jgi:ribonucleoside-diphosphate reductase alpha chain
MRTLNDLVDAVKVAMQVMELYDGVSTSELDNLAAGDRSFDDYCIQIMHNAAKIAISNHSNTTKSFSETMTEMFEYVNQEMDNTLR